MYNYYTVRGDLFLDGSLAEGCGLFSSYDKEDCIYEIEAERDSWKGEGYKNIRIEKSLVTVGPDPEVYPHFF